MKKDYYTDELLGEWNLIKKEKEYLTYRRSKEVNLHKTHAMKHFEGTVPYHVWGKLTLRQEKKIHIPTSISSLYNFIDFSDATEKEKVII